MKPSQRRQRGRNGLELVEEAIHLLRTAPGAALAAYYAGGLPFILGLLWFFADMSRNPYAPRHVTSAALGLALLFLWLKFWQAVFLNILRARLSGEAPPRWSWRRAWRMFVVQAMLQPSATLVLPLATLAAALPLPWAYAFYQNVTSLNHDEAEVRDVFKRSWKQATLWPGQNHLILGIFLLFGGCIFINLGTLCLALPQLIKLFLGIESVYTQSVLALLNTTFFAAVFGLTWLCLDPLVKTVYLLRCFYGESLQSGEDLKAELKSFAPAASFATIAVLLLCLSGAPSLNAADAPPPAPAAAPSISTPELDQTINDVIHQQKYAWRMPREKIPQDDDAQQGLLSRFLIGVRDTIVGWLKGFFHWVGKIITWVLDWVGRLLRRLHWNGGGGGGNPDGGHWMDILQGFFFVLIVLTVCGLVFLLYRVWRKRSGRLVMPIASEALPPTPDLADESVDAGQLPEDGWMKLGRELLGRGELRLALRAFYFASLAHLAARNLIAIAKFKSNRDYERELSRRGHALPGVLTLFGENVSVFDRSWYGLHEVNPELVHDFIAKVERIKAV